MVGIFGPMDPIPGVPLAQPTEAEQAKAAAEVEAERREELRRTELLLSCVGRKVTGIEVLGGMIQFKFDHGVVVDFDDGWATVTYGDESSCGGFYEYRKTNLGDAT